MTDIELLNDKIIELNYNKKSLKNNILNNKEKLNKLEKQVENHIKARDLLIKILSDTQNNFALKVESLVTKAINIVFSDRNFKFKFIFEEKRNNIECRPVIYEDGKEKNIENDLGGSIWDIIGFALRLVLINLENPQKRLFIALDEPFKWLGELRQKAGIMMKEICHALNMQVLMVTHDEELIEMADKVYRIEYKKGIGSVLI